jgi:hypothetical protein
VPPHAACDQPAAGALGPPCASQPRKQRRGEVSCVMSRVFAMLDEDAVYEEIVGFNRAQSYVDAFGELIATRPAVRLALHPHCMPHSYPYASGSV